MKGASQKKPCILVTLVPLKPESTYQTSYVMCAWAIFLDQAINYWIMHAK